MIPWRKPNGKEAYKRIKVYIGVPADELKKFDIPLPKPEDQIKKKKLRRKIMVWELCQVIGGKW
jgi:ribosomal protein L13